MNQETLRLGTKPVGELLWKFSIPAIMTFLVGTIYTATDRFFIGRVLGDSGIAALGVVAPMFMIAIAIGIMCGVGGNTMFSMRLGSGEIDKANRIFRTTVWMQLIFCAVYILGGSLFMNDILLLSGASESTLPLARQYLIFLMLGMTFDVVANGLNQFVRSIGKPNRAMINAVAGTALNIVLDYVFVIKMNMGMVGAGLATVIGMILMFALVVTSFNNSVIKFGYSAPRLSTMIKIFKYGSSPFLVHISFAIYGFVVNGILAKNGGDIAIGAWTVALMIEQFFVLPAFGFTQAMQSIVGYNWGANKLPRVREALVKTIMATEIWLVIAGLCMFFLGGEMAGLFTGGESSFLAWDFLKVFVIAYPFVALVFVSGMYMNAVGCYKRSLVLNFLRTIGFAIPAVVVFSEMWGLNGIMTAVPTSNYMTGIVAVCLMIGPWKVLAGHRRPKLAEV